MSGEEVRLVFEIKSVGLAEVEEAEWSMSIIIIVLSSQPKISVSKIILNNMKFYYLLFHWCKNMPFTMGRLNRRGLKRKYRLDQCL